MSPLVDLAGLLVFILSLPETRVRLTADFLIWLLDGILVILIAVFIQTRPVIDFLKVTLQSRVTSGSIAISTLAPRVGRYIDERNLGFHNIRRWFDQRIGNEMVDYRDNIRQVFCRNRRFDDIPSSGELLVDIERAQEKIRRRHTYGEIVIGAVGSILAVFIGQFSILARVGIALSVFLFVLPLSMFLRDVVVDTLAYSASMADPENEEISPRRPARSFLFMREWNELLIREESVIHRFIFVGFLMGEFPSDVDRGIELLETVVAGEMEVDEALENLIEEELGDETWEARKLSSLLRRYFGISD